ncbi:MAG: cyclic nucleotide-binding domain-containing protein, partial [Chloroflexi bacterium]|nr:cyclic nucleotide-binding domain-containing protein [Chloroflexota bacterium]
AERTHYILSLFSAVIYIVAWFSGPLPFRNTWVTVMLGLYIYDMAIIARDWHSLKKSYRVFYTAHHLVSFSLFGLWGATFEQFTPAMAIGAVLWMTSDVWRWADQISRLGGRFTPAWVDRVIFWLERSQRILAYIVGFYTVGFVPQFREEFIIVGSAFMMDGIDTWFQLRAASARKTAAAFITELCKNAPVFKGLDNADLDQLAELMSNRSYEADEIILNQGELGDKMLVVLEGAAIAELTDGTVLEQLAPGDIAGEMSLLTGSRRNATVWAETAVKAGVVIREKFLGLIAKEPVLYDAVWRSFAARTFNLYMRDLPEWTQLDQTGRLEWIKQGQLLSPIVDEEMIPNDNEFLFVITGAVEKDDYRTKAPALFSLVNGEQFRSAAPESLVMLLPKVPVM